MAESFRNSLLYTGLVSSSIRQRLGILFGLKAVHNGDWGRSARPVELRVITVIQKSPLRNCETRNLLPCTLHSFSGL